MWNRERERALRACGGRKLDGPCREFQLLFFCEEVPRKILLGSRPFRVYVHLVLKYSCVSPKLILG